MKVSEVKRKVKVLESDKLYSIDDIVKLGLIVDSKLQPSRFKVYKLIQSGELPATNLGNKEGRNPRWFVQGKHLRAYVSKLLNIKF